MATVVAGYVLKCELTLTAGAAELIMRRIDALAYFEGTTFRDAKVSILAAGAKRIIVSL